jgi:hypothetical protein
MADNLFVMKDDQCLVFKEPDPPKTLTLYSPDGREAVIDFGGDEVEYSGDLPVAESAKIFFACVFEQFRR